MTAGLTELQSMQRNVSEWAYEAHRWEDRIADMNLLLTATGLAEEVGELERCVTKMVEGIRGSRSEWVNEAEKEAGDVLARLLELCELLGIDLSVAAHERFAVVMARSVNHDPLGSAS